MNNEELDDNAEIESYCIYCKEPILKGHPVTKDGDKDYHPNCYKSLCGIEEDEDSGDITSELNFD